MTDVTLPNIWFSEYLKIDMIKKLIVINKDDDGIVFDNTEIKDSLNINDLDLILITKISNNKYRLSNIIHELKDETNLKNIIQEIYDKYYTILYEDDVVENIVDAQDYKYINIGCKIFVDNNANTLKESGVDPREFIKAISIDQQIKLKSIFDNEKLLRHIDEFINDYIDDSRKFTYSIYISDNEKQLINKLYDFVKNIKDLYNESDFEKDATLKIYEHLYNDVEYTEIINTLFNILDTNYNIPVIIYNDYIKINKYFTNIDDINNTYESREEHKIKLYGNYNNSLKNIVTVSYNNDKFMVEILYDNNIADINEIYDVINNIIPLSEISQSTLGIYRKKDIQFDNIYLSDLILNNIVYQYFLNIDERLTLDKRKSNLYITDNINKNTIKTSLISKSAVDIKEKPGIFKDIKGIVEFIEIRVLKSVGEETNKNFINLLLNFLDNTYYDKNMEEIENEYMLFQKCIPEYKYKDDEDREIYDSETRLKTAWNKGHARLCPKVGLKSVKGKREERLPELIDDIDITKNNKDIKFPFKTKEDLKLYLNEDNRSSIETQISQLFKDKNKGLELKSSDDSDYYIPNDKLFEYISLIYKNANINSLNYTCHNKKENVNMSLVENNPCITSIENVDRFPLIPCCQQKISYVLLELIEYLFERLDTTELTQVGGKKAKLKTNILLSYKYLSRGRKGRVDSKFEEILKKNIGKYTDQYMRISAGDSLHSILDCLNIIFKKTYTRVDLHEVLNSNPNICNNEMYEMDFSEQQKYILDENLYLDPKNVIKLLEKLYNVNIFLCEKIPKKKLKKGEDKPKTGLFTHLVFPKYKNTYNIELNYDSSVLIHIYNDFKETPDDYSLKLYNNSYICRKQSEIITINQDPVIDAEKTKLLKKLYDNVFRFTKIDIFSDKKMKYLWKVLRDDEKEHFIRLENESKIELKKQGNIIKQFTDTEKLSRYLLQCFIWKFSNYIKDKDSIDINDLDDFKKDCVHVDISFLSKYRDSNDLYDLESDDEKSYEPLYLDKSTYYDVRDIFKTNSNKFDSELLNNKKLLILGKNPYNTLSYLEFSLKQLYNNNISLLQKYYNLKYIPYFYDSINDYQQTDSQYIFINLEYINSILHRKNEILYEINYQDYQPYFYKGFFNGKEKDFDEFNDDKQNKLYLVQKCNMSKDLKDDIIHNWVNFTKNTGNILSKYKISNTEFTKIEKKGYVFYVKSIGKDVLCLIEL